MTNFLIPYLLDSLWFMKLVTRGTLVLKLALRNLIWFKKFRGLLIYAGVIFHLGIEYILSIPFFEIVMIILLLNYFSPEEHRSLRSFLKEKIVRIVANCSSKKSVKEKIF